MALHKRVRRMLVADRGRYAGIVILVLLGSFYFTVASGIAGSLERMVVTFADEGRQQDLTFTVDEPLSDLSKWETEAGATIEEQRGHNVSLPDGELRLLGANTKVDLPTVLSGHDLQRPGEVLLDPRFLEMQDLQIGDTLTLDGRPFTVVGTATVPNYVYITKNFYDVLPTTGFGIGIVSDADVDTLPSDAGDARTTYGVRFADRENLDAQLRSLRERLTDDGHVISEWLAAENNARINMPWGNISSMQSMSSPVALAFFLLSCVIVSVMIMHTLRSESVVIGTLHALGYRRRELIRHYLANPVLASAVGAGVGTLLGLVCIRPVLDTMLATYNLPDTGLWFTPLKLAFAVLGPVLLVGAVSLLVIRRILRRHSADLMKGGAKAAKVNAIERVLQLDRFRFVTMYRLREQVRNIPRLLFLMLGVSAASTIMLFGLTFNTSMSTVTDNGAVTRYAYPLEYNFNQTRNLQQDPLPGGAEPYHTLRVHPEGRESVDFYLIGMQPDSVGMKLNDLKGAQLPRDQVNITSPLADRLGLSEGDTIHIVNELDGAGYSLRIDGIVHAYGEQFVTMPLDDLNLMTGYPAGSYRTVLADHEMEFEENELAGVLDTRDPEAFDDVGAPTELIVTSVAALAVLIAVVILFLVTSLIIGENRNTISLLKVLGYRRNEIARLILNSTTPVVVIGIVLGLPLMLGFGNILYGLVAEATNMLIPMIISPLQIVIGFAVIFATYQITKRLSARRVARVPMSEALKATTE